MNHNVSSTNYSRAVMIAMFVVAIGMLIGAISLLTSAYHQSEKNAAQRAEKPAKPALEKDKESETAAPASMGEALSIATSNPWFWWTLLNTVLMSGLGLFYLLRKPPVQDIEEQNDDDRQWGKLGLFAMLSLIGFLTVACLAIPYTWMHSGELLNRQGWSTMDPSWLPWAILLGYVLGLGGMFASLLAVKSEERTNANLRRWIYGFNAFLGALLFLAILGVINAFFALYGPEPSDWTASNIYSLSPSMKKLVRAQDKPIRAYVFMRPSLQQQDILGTLNSCKSLTSQLEIVEMNPTSDAKEIDSLIKKYEVLRDVTGLAEGILLVQDPNSEKPLSTFLKKEDLEEYVPPMGGMGSGQSYYKGEQVLFTAFRDFRQEKKKVTVYFTQDSGELSIDESAARPRGASPVSRSIVGLKRRIENAGYVVKPLNLGESEVGSKEPPKVPDDALLVIVADPIRMTPQKEAILDAYLKRPKKADVDPGKLIVLLDPHYGPDNKVLPTGLEAMLGGYGVQVGKDVLYSILGDDPNRDPTQSMIAPLPDLPVDPDIIESVYGLMKNSPVDLVFKECRTVKPIPANQSYDVKSLLYAFTNKVVSVGGSRRMAIWPEDSNIPKPAEYVRNLVRSPDFAKKEFSQIPPSVAVTVRDKGASQPPSNPMMPPPPAKLGTPRMMVFGDATFITDSEAQSNGDQGSQLILTSLAWARGKPELDSDVPPRERKAYKLRMNEDTLVRAIWLPPLWLLLAVILLGVGVAVLRRS